MAGQPLERAPGAHEPLEPTAHSPADSVLARPAQGPREWHWRRTTRADGALDQARDRCLALVTAAPHVTLVVTRKFLVHEPIVRTIGRVRTGSVQTPSRNSVSV